MSHISETHHRISERFSNRDILNNPEKHFGPNYKILLNFWIIRDNHKASWDDEISRSDDHCYEDAIKVVESDIAWWCSGVGREIIAAHLILDAGKELQGIQSIKVR